MRNKGKTRMAVIALICILVLVLALDFATKLVTPKRFDTGSTWGQYLKEDRSSIDVMYYGTSRTYCNIIPAVIWEESGIASYVMGGAAQTMPVTYYTVCETLKTQSPSVAMIEVSSLIYSRFTGFTKANIGYFPFGINRIKAAFTDAEKENIFGLLFPLSFYHSRWSSLKAEDWQIALHGYEKDPLAGYTYLDICKPFTERAEWALDPAEAELERNMDYLKKIVDICREKGVTPVLFVAPSYAYYPDDFDNVIARRVSELDGAIYMDFNDVYDELGIDPSTDYQEAVHFNMHGAEKFSRYLASWLTETLGLEPSRAADKELWNERVTYFYEKKGV